MRVLFSMHFEPGHHMGTFRLAKALASRGHSVAYLGIAAVRKIIEDQGFEFIEFASHLFAKPESGREAADTGSTQSKQSRRDAAETLFRRYTTAIIDGTLDDCLRQARPDLLLCDSFLWYVSLRAYHLRIPTIQISTSLFYYDNPHIPPAVTGITPRKGFLSEVRVLLAWKRMHLKYLFTKKLASHFLGAFRAPLRMHHLTSTFRWVARHSQFPCHRKRTYVLDEIGAHLVLPEIVLCTASFQFPGKLPKERRYCGDFIDFDRKEPPLPFDPAGKKIVFCSLGTSAGAYGEAKRFFSAVADASGKRPDWFFVLHISDPKLIDEFQSTENLFVAPWISQLSLLKHAAVMVSHGGLNSIMECIQCEVPMVLVPCARDQPGNAARAAFHQIAVTANIQTITAEGLLGLIDSAMNEPHLRANLKRMKESIAAEQGLRQAVAFIEDVVVGGERAGIQELNLETPAPQT